MADTQNAISDNALLQQGYTYKGNSRSYSMFALRVQSAFIE